MIKLRPYYPTDAAEVLSWCQSEKSFYQWTAGRLGDYPASVQAFAFTETVMPFIALDTTEPIGFFTLRTLPDRYDELRFGFIIINPTRRGTGCGKAMLRLGLQLAFEKYDVERVSLGVFSNNPSAYHCYRSIGFSERPDRPSEEYSLMGEKWECIDLAIERKAFNATI